MPTRPNAGVCALTTQLNYLTQLLLSVGERFSL